MGMGMGAGLLFICLKKLVDCGDRSGRVGRRPL